MMIWTKQNKAQSYVYFMGDSAHARLKEAPFSVQTHSQSSQVQEGRS